MMHPSSTPSILLVEDDSDLREMYASALKRAGFTVAIAKNGKEALDQVKLAAPSFMLLDIVMPEYDGFWVLNALRQDEKLKNIPVIALTNLGSEKDKARAISLGVKEYLLKVDFTPSLLIERIKNYL